jgi:hypothetical protein
LFHDARPLLHRVAANVVAAIGAPRGFARNGEIVEPDQADLPCPVPDEEIFLFFRIFYLLPDPNHFHIPAIPSHSGGRCATSTARDGDAVDADGAFDESA